MGEDLTRFPGVNRQVGPACQGDISQVGVSCLAGRPRRGEIPAAGQRELVGVEQDLPDHGGEPGADPGQALLNVSWLPLPK